MDWSRFVTGSETWSKEEISMIAPEADKRTISPFALASNGKASPRASD
jgi:hypothetical protein